MIIVQEKNKLKEFFPRTTLIVLFSQCIDFFLLFRLLTFRELFEANNKCFSEKSKRRKNSQP